MRQGQVEHYGRMGNSCDGAWMWATTGWAGEHLENSQMDWEKRCHQLQANTEIGHGQLKPKKQKGKWDELKCDFNLRKINFFLVR